MISINTNLIFQPKTQPAKLTELLSDFKPRTVDEIKQTIPSIQVSNIAKRANEALKHHGLEIQTQLHPRQRKWWWLLVAVSQVEAS